MYYMYLEQIHTPKYEKLAHIDYTYRCRCVNFQSSYGAVEIPIEQPHYLRGADGRSISGTGFATGEVAHGTRSSS